MKKSVILIFFLSAIVAFYLGMTVQSDHPMDELYENTIDAMNKAHVVKFKSGFAINHFDSIDSVQPIYQWQMKRQGTYDAWSKYLHYENVIQYDQSEDSKEAEEKTSLTPTDPENNLVLLPIKEVYFKNNKLFTLDRESNTWSYEQRETLNLLEILPFHSEVLNRYAKHYKSDNRGKYVVYFFSVDPNYLTRTFQDIIQSEDYDFPYRFREGTIKILLYPDAEIPRRVYSLFVIENLTNNEIIRYHINTYFSIDEDYQGEEEPAIPQEVMETMIK